MKYLLLALGLVGCGYANRPEHYPTRGSLICVVNNTSEPLTVVSRRSDGAALVSWPRLNPGSTAQFRWPFIDNHGLLIAGPFYVSLEPWSASYWRWVVAPRDGTFVSSPKPLC